MSGVSRITTGLIYQTGAKRLNNAPCNMTFNGDPLKDVIVSYIKKGGSPAEITSNVIKVIDNNGVGLKNLESAMNQHNSDSTIVGALRTGIRHILNKIEDQAG